MTRNINYKDTLFEQDDLTPIHGKPNFKTFHKLQNNIKANAKSDYSNLGKGAHVHLGLVLNDVQYAHILTAPSIYLTRPGQLIIPDGTTAHASSNMRIAHTNKVCLFRLVTGVEQALVQKYFATVEENYLADIRNRTTNSINDIAAVMMNHLQDIYGQLMLHDLLKRKNAVKKTIYNPQDPIATVFSAVEELLDFDDITGPLYTQDQVVNIEFFTGWASSDWRFANGITR